MKASLLMHTVPRGLMVAVMVAFVAVKTPYVEEVSIARIQRHAGVWTVEGTITTNPAEVPPGLQYNYDEPGFLSWWEEHINDVLTEHGIKFVRVQRLELAWVEIGDLDVISFQAELVFGHARHGNPPLFKNAKFINQRNAESLENLHYIVSGA